MWQHSMDTLAACAVPRCSAIAARIWPRQHSHSWNCAKRGAAQLNRTRCQNATTAVDATAGRSLDSIPRSRPQRKAGSVHQDEVIIVGAGIAGLATAAACQKVWHATASAGSTWADMVIAVWVNGAEQPILEHGHTIHPAHTAGVTPNSIRGAWSHPLRGRLPGGMVPDIVLPAAAGSPQLRSPQPVTADTVALCAGGHPLRGV